MGLINSKSLVSLIDISFSALRNKLTLSVWVILAFANAFAHFFERSYVNAPYDTATIRLAICLILLPLFTKGSAFFLAIEGAHKSYFLAGAFLLLPFMFTHILLMNASLTPSGGELSALLLYEYFIASFIFTGLISKLRAVVAMQVGAYAICVTIVLFVPERNTAQIISISIGMLATQLTLLVFSSLTHRSMNFVAQEKISAIYSIGTSIAHELRTPLLTIRNLALGATQILGEELKPKEPSRLRLARSRIEKIEREVDYSNTVIDMLLMNTKERTIQSEGYPLVAASLIVHEALARYPFNNSSEKRIISINKRNDFSIQGSQLLLVHVLLNLLKNALTAIESYTDRDIVIVYGIVSRSQKAFIEVNDNGSGVAPENEAEIFDSFFTTRTAGVGTGIGLAFCKSVVEDIGGEIRYRRKDGRSHFTLFFRKHHQLTE